MLRSFRVANHRSIRREQEWLLAPVYGPRSRPALPVSAVFGANASGKSNLLDALRWFQDAVLNSYRTWDPFDDIPREVCQLDVAAVIEPSSFVVDLVLDGVQWVYGVSLERTAVLEEWLYTYPHQHKRVIFERKGQDVELGSTIPKHRRRARTLRSLLQENALLLSTAVQANQPEALPVHRWFRTGLAFVDRPSRPRSLAVLTEQVAEAKQVNPGFVELLGGADLDIRDVRVVDEIGYAPDPSDGGGAPRLRRRRQLLFEHGPAGMTLPSEQESSGTLVWLELVVAATKALAAGTALVIDEIGASLHPRLIARLVELFHDARTNPKSAQMLFTTHDVTLLGTGPGDTVLHRDEVWFIEKDRGESRLYPLSGFRPRKGENGERRYLAGSYGAVPAVLPGSLVERLALGGDHDAAA